MLNHFTPRSPMLAKVEESLTGATSRVLGFHAAFPLEPLFERAGIDIDGVRRVTPIGSWYAVTFTRSAS